MTSLRTDDASQLPTPADLAAYELAPPVTITRFARQGVNNALFLVTTGTSRLVLKVYTHVHDVASLHYEHGLLGRLSTAGLPFALPTPLATCEGATLVNLPAGWASLAPFFGAEPLDPTSLDHAAWLGAALGELHTALARLPSAPRPGHNLFTALFDYPPERYPARALTAPHLGLPADRETDALLNWWRAEVAALEAFVAGGYPALPWQLCHNDPAPSNVLVGRDRIAALLDFEFACPAPRALDLAMALRMTMRVWENADPWPAAQAMLGTYTEGVALTVAEAQALPMLIRLRSAIPVLWKLGRIETPDDAAVVLRGIAFLRNATVWLEQHGSQLVDVAASEVARVHRC
jgi:Ser/Thr protein kinase RdoA (MazF antagonist)